MRTTRRKQPAKQKAPRPAFDMTRLVFWRNQQKIEPSPEIAEAIQGLAAEIVAARKRRAPGLGFRNPATLDHRMVILTAVPGCYESEAAWVVVVQGSGPAWVEMMETYGCRERESAVAKSIRALAGLLFDHRLAVYREEVQKNPALRYQVSYTAAFQFSNPQWAREVDEGGQP